MSYPLGGPVVFFSVSPHGKTQEPMVVGQPWALDVTSFGLANPETNELGWGAQLKNEGEPREEEQSPLAESENTISPLRFRCIRYRLSVRSRLESPYC